MGVEFFDRDGQPLELMDWARKYEDIAYRDLAVDVDRMDNPHIMVSTIWEGVPRPLSLMSTGLPRGIFATALLIDGHIQWERRHDTEEQAREFHRESVIFHLNREPDNGEVLAEIVRRDREARAAARRNQDQ